MSRSVLYYVSGHGFGHAARSAEVIRAMTTLCPEWSVHVRTQAPARFFALPGEGISVERVAIDKGVAELQGGLQIDHRTTLKQLRLFVAQQEDLIVSEVKFVRDSRTSLILADVPYLAGEVAGRTGIPCIAIANFTWDWIFETFLDESADGRELMSTIRGGYSQMKLWLRLPFSHTNQAFTDVKDVPLVARRATHDPEYVLQQIGIPPDDTRPRVLVSSRGPISPEVFSSAVMEGNDMLFLHLDPACRDLPSNAVRVQLGKGEVDFIDVVQVCQAVISKLGYGILADCIAGNSAILYPPREGFREDTLLRSGAAKYLRAREIPLVDFRHGRWAIHVRSLLEMEPAIAPINTNGAHECAKCLSDHF